MLSLFFWERKKMYYVYDLLKDKIIFKSVDPEELLKALNMRYDQSGFALEKIYKNKYVITKKKPTKKRLTPEEKIKIIISEFSLTKNDFERISKEELKMIEQKITKLRIPKIYWTEYLSKTNYRKNRKTYLHHKIKELLETARLTTKDLRKPRLKDLEKLDSMLEEFEIDTVAWYHYLEGMIEWTKKN